MNYSSKVEIVIVINSFTGCSSNQEYSESVQLLEYFKSKKIKLLNIIDINQELNFSSTQKLTKNIRLSYHIMGKLFKLGNTYPLPQIIINNQLCLTYSQFKILTEATPTLFFSILQGKHCLHLRFENDKLVYPNEYIINNNDSSNNICIYCYSNKKIKKRITFFTDARNYHNEYNSSIFTFCEENALTMEIVDVDNIFLYNTNNYNQSIQERIKQKEKDFFYLDNNDKELYNMECFYEVLEKAQNEKGKEGKCIKCGKGLNVSSGVNICIDCCLSKSGEYGGNWCSNSYSSLNGGKLKKNPYTFIEKLKLKKIGDLSYENINSDDYLNDDNHNNNKGNHIISENNSGDKNDTNFQSSLELSFT